MKSRMIPIVLGIAAWATLASAANITVTPGYRQIDDFFIPLAPGIAEASIRMTLTADRPITLAEPNPLFIQLDTQTFITDFPWNYAVPHIGVFVDDLGDTTTVEVYPSTSFMPPADTRPIITITTDSTGLWDPETGIYVEGNYINFEQRGGSWERAAQFQFFEPGLGITVDEPIGLRIHGGFSRFYHQKGLRCYFDDYGTADQVEYPFFITGPASFRRLICRPNRFDSVAINTTLAEAIFGDLGHVHSRARFASLYLNDEYWGGYNLKERLDDEFFEHTWEVAEKGNWNSIKDGDTEEGNPDSWWNFLNDFLNGPHPEDDAWLDTARATMDLASYIDWLIINLFFVPTDNGFAWNLAMYQPGEHPWRFVMWDEDLIMNSANFQTNTFRFFTAQNQTEWDAHKAPTDVRPWTPDRQRWFTMFRSLLNQPDFRSLFRSRMEYLLGGPMAESQIHARLDAIVAEQAPVIPGHATRWEGFQEDWYAGYVANTHDWITNRFAIFEAQLDSFYTEWPAPTPADYTGLMVNEIMALNTATIEDESGDLDAWIELINTDTQTINLTGVGLTLDLTPGVRWDMPATMIRPGDHLLVWLDGQEAEGALHAPLKLQASGDHLRLRTPVAAGDLEIASHLIPPMTADTAVGRVMDGSPTWGPMQPPTPGWANHEASPVSDEIPANFALQANVPNPFNPSTVIPFEMARAGRVALKIYNARGELVKTLIDEPRTAGHHTTTWNGTDTAGQAVASGVYYARLESNGDKRTRSMTLVR